MIMPSASVSVRSLSEVEKHLGSRMDRSAEGSFLSVPVRRGSSENNLDLDLDRDQERSDAVTSPSSEVQRSRSCLDNLQQKILKVTERLKIEQTARDDNVAEYLQLVNGADKQQLGRIKQVFEKKNQKSAHNIAQMQKKLEQYHRKMKDSEVQHAPPAPASCGKHSTIPRESRRELLRDMTGSGRHPTMDKIKTIGPGVSLSPPFFFSKPREIANLIRNKFGSADNIAHMKVSVSVSPPPPPPLLPPPPDEATKALSGGASPAAGKPKYPSDDECSSGSASNSADSNGVPGQGRPAEGDALARLAAGAEEARVIREAQNQLEEDMEEIKTQMKRDFGVLSQTLQEERYRSTRLEDQLNDLTELHQHEMTDLKQELASVEERVAYQAQERARDIQVVNGVGEPASSFFLSVLSCLVLSCLVCGAGGPGVVPDARIQAGVPAAAAADGATGERRRPRSAGPQHQHHAGHHHRHPGVRLHRRQVRRPAPEEPPPRGRHLAGPLPPRRLLEEPRAPALCHRPTAAARVAPAGRCSCATGRRQFGSLTIRLGNNLTCVTTLVDLSTLSCSGALLPRFVLKRL
ncbi:transmembrane and coiled-coil domain protein 3 isoform X1 [Syngnathus scovelli]|uniref:transmembrane and coiled-coil domain protein 3 isoform X1 n=1 Tax=Syngnathus scovelli TaxID=161590 RepID=UPI00210F65CB|nr:transmembrane and coiled-coil domain protein 3 isoform X1 [Syngnathus scovelli]